MAQLRDYQELDVQRILKQKHIGIFSQQRTGKTPVACSVVSRATCKKIIIICPNSLTYMWKDALLEWAGIEADVLKTATFIAKEYTGKALIINYEKIRMNSIEYPIVRELNKLHPDCIIVDEVHRIKNRKSQTREAVLALVRKTTPEYLMALTGTPAPNKLWDVWSILNLIAPKAYTSYWRWVDKYFYTQSNFSGRTEPAALKVGVAEEFAKELSDHAIQHTRKEVMEWEVDIPITTIHLPADPEQLIAIESLTSVYEYKHVITKNTLHTMTVVRQLLSAPKILKLKIPSPKTKWLFNYITDYNDKSIVIFSLSRKYLELLKADMDHVNIRATLITGDTKLTDRKEYIRAFQAGEIKILLCQTQTVKEGLTLDTADTAIFLDVYPPMADFLQAKDRIVATTPERVKPKEILCPVIANTYDEHLHTCTRAGMLAGEVITDFHKYYKMKGAISNGKPNDSI